MEHQVNVTIIMTTYNSELYVYETIDSILNQSFKEFKFIIIDDGSTDSTASIIKNIRDSRVTIIQSRHAGKPAALNKALEEVKTEFVAFTDHDDISAPHRFRLQYDYLNSHPDVGVLSSWYYVCDKNGAVIRGEQIPHQHEEIEDMMTTHCSMRFPGLMMRTKLFVEYGKFDESLVNGTDDYELFLRMLPHTRFNNIPEYLLYHRRHERAFSLRIMKEQNDSAKTLSLKYLENQLRNEHTNKGYVYYRMGLTEYYKGTMKKARYYFHLAITNGYRSVLSRRYYWATYLGDSIFSVYRNIVNKRQLAY